VLPALRGVAEHPALANVLEAPHSLRWLTTDLGNSDDILIHHESARLVADLPRRRSDVGKPAEAADFALWEGARGRDVLQLALARRAEHVLSEEAPKGAPGLDDQTRWLRFNRLSLELAMLLDQSKANAFRIQLVRQIARGNSLGVLLSIRSLIEHRALTVWLPETVRRSLGDVAVQMRANQPLPQAEAAHLEQQIANFLTVQAKGSQEARRPWTVEENGGARNAWLNLGGIVRAAFPEDDQFRKIYALASAAMHGRTSRGIELLRQTASGEFAGGLGVVVLERLCEPHEDMSPAVAAAIVAIQLTHAERFDASSHAATDLMAQQIFGRIDQPLVSGVDYFGEGTADDPFRIGAHLQFHTASFALLNQLGVDNERSQRQLSVDSTGRLCDRWQAPKRDYWFLANLLQQPNQP
jgi:hypothetical protein